MKKHVTIGLGTLVVAFLFLILPTADIFDFIVGAALLKFFGIYVFLYFIIIMLFIATLLWYYGRIK